MKPAPSRRADYALFRSIQTRWFDNDVYGHMNNAMHYQLFDTAVNAHLVETGVLDIKRSPTVFLVVETGCRYFDELAFPDPVAAGVRVDRLGGSSVRYRVGLFRDDAETAAADGHFVHVNVDRETRRPVAIQPAARRVLSALMVDPSPPE